MTKATTLRPSTWRQLMFLQHQCKLLSSVTSQRPQRGLLVFGRTGVGKMCSEEESSCWMTHILNFWSRVSSFCLTLKTMTKKSSVVRPIMFPSSHVGAESSLSSYPCPLQRDNPFVCRICFKFPSFPLVSLKYMQLRNSVCMTLVIPHPA